MVLVKNKIIGSKEHIIECYEKSTTFDKHYGRNFYSLAQQKALLFGQSFGYPNDLALQVGAGLLAVYSPKMDWGRNIKVVEEFVNTGTVRNSTALINSNAQLISKCHDPMIVLGRLAYKTKAFYSAIRDPHGNQKVYNLEGIDDGYSLCTIDRHAGGVYNGEPLIEKERNYLGHPKVYKRISNAYFNVARRLNIHVNDLQAITWYQFRGEYKYISIAAIKNKQRKEQTINK